MDFNLNGGSKRVFDRLGGSIVRRRQRAHVRRFVPTGERDGAIGTLASFYTESYRVRVTRTKGSPTNLGLRVRVTGEDPGLTGTLVITGGGSVGTGR